jgi:nitrogen fixation protein FixH
MWLAGFFAIVIATNAYFIVLSVTTFRGEDEQKPYLQGIEYNDTLDRRAQQARLGRRATVSATRLPTGHVRIDAELHDRDGQPVAGVPLLAELRHPSDENRDRVLRLRAIAPGRYEADAGSIGAGYWDLIVSSTKAGAPFEATRRLWVP